MDKSFVTMEQKLCPICGKTHDSGALLLDKRMRNKFEMHTVTGYDLCKECDAKNKEGYIALVVIDPEKSKPKDGKLNTENAYRTGGVIHMKRDAAARMFKDIPIELPMIFIDIELGEKLRIMSESVNKPKTKAKKKK